MHTKILPVLKEFVAEGLFHVRSAVGEAGRDRSLRDEMKNDPGHHHIERSRGRVFFLKLHTNDLDAGL